MFEILASDCTKLMPVLQFIKKGVYPIIQFGIPILIIILGSIDLGKAVVGGDEKKTKEATNGLLKRFAYGVAVFFIPIIVDLVFGMFTESGDAVLKSVNFASCWNAKYVTAGVACNADEICPKDHTCKSGANTCPTVDSATGAYSYTGCTCVANP